MDKKTVEKAREQVIESVRGYKQQGLSHKSVSEKVGYSPETIYLICKKHNITKKVKPKIPTTKIQISKSLRIELKARKLRPKETYTDVLTRLLRANK